MDTLAVSWLLRASLFAVAAGVWVKYLLNHPRHWLAPIGLFVSVYTVIVHVWSIIERPTQPETVSGVAGMGFSIGLTIAQGVNWGLLGALLIIAGFHAIHIRKTRDETYVKLASIVHNERDVA